MINALIEENIALKEALFIIREIAMCEFDDRVVGIVSRTIGDFTIPEKRIKVLLEEYNVKGQHKKTNPDKT